MKSITIEATGQEVRMKTRIERAIEKVIEPKKGHYHLKFVPEPKDNGHGYRLKRTEIHVFTDKEAEMEFRRWASVLNEEIVLSIFRAGHPKAGRMVGDYDAPEEGETIDEAKSVFEWGKELAALENEELLVGSYKLVRMRMISKMFADAKLVWRGSPRWWHQL